MPAKYLTEPWNDGVKIGKENITKDRTPPRLPPEQRKKMQKLAKKRKGR